MEIGKTDQQDKLTISLSGPLKVTNGQCEDFTPRGQKACGIVALLIMAPKYSRSRKWLQDKLWSDRGEAQGSASLRQTLTEIRRSFGDAYSGILHTDRTMVSLQEEHILVERFKKNQIHALEQILLEGLDIRDPEFEAWLRDQRMLFEEEIPNTADRPLNSAHVRSLSTNMQTGHVTPNLLLLKDRQNGSKDDAFVADTLSDTVAKLASEIGLVEVLDYRTPINEIDLSLGQHQIHSTLAIKTEFNHGTGNAGYRLLIFNPTSNKMIWSTSINNLNHGEDHNEYLADPDLLRSLNIAASKLTEELHQKTDQGMRGAQHLCFLGVRQLFRLGDKNLGTADQLFADAFNIEPKGIYLAWRAYLRTFLIAERKCEDIERTTEEALYFARKSYEADAHNSFVLSLCAHVYAIASCAYAPAYDLAMRSVEINPANPLGWIGLAVAESQLGDPEKAFSFALRARKIAGTTPFRYHIDALCCIVGVLAGKLEQAEHFGESSHAFAPEFAAPIRFLSGLYFHGKKYDLAEKMLLKLKSLEPDFSLELLHDSSYPVESLRKSSIIKSVPSKDT